MSPAVLPVGIERVDGSCATQLDDLLAVEEALEIRLGESSLTITMRTPGDDFELAAGFLFSEAIIRSLDDVRTMGRPDAESPNVITVQLEDDSAAPVRGQRHFVMSSACGVCGKESLNDLKANGCPVLPPDRIRLRPEMFHALPGRLRRDQSAFDSTGGIHAAGLFTLRGDLEAVREDIGRHNAVDKLMGAALFGRRMPLRESILVVSGRAGFELVQKALVAGIPVMAAVGAPSSLAVATAERCGMTLVGFLRDGRFNIYTGAQRMVCSEPADLQPMEDLQSTEQAR